MLLKAIPRLMHKSKKTFVTRSLAAITRSITPF